MMPISISALGKLDMMRKLMLGAVLVLLSLLLWIDSPAFAQMQTGAQQAGQAGASDQLANLDKLLAEIARVQQKNSDFLWVLICAALMLLMQGGFLLLEAGMVRSKNGINVAQKNFCDIFISVATFFLIGYGIMFGPSLLGGAFGFQISHLWDFNEIDINSHDDKTLVTFALFSLYAGTATTIITGAVAERMKFSTFMIISVFVAGFVFPVFGHWVWGNLVYQQNTAWLANAGFMDFAGATYVHSMGGWISLAAVIIIGPRIGRFSKDGKPQVIPGHSMVLATIGAILLFVGWLGFNGGAAKLGSPELNHILANTILGGTFGSFTSMLIGYRYGRVYKPEDSINGMIAGLVAVTAGSDVLPAFGAMVLGIIAAFCYHIVATMIEQRFKLDDAVGAFPAHGVSGAVGTILFVFFVPADDLHTKSHYSQFLVQCLGVFTCFVWSFGLGYIFLKLLDRYWGLRVTPEDEIAGLNLTEHGASLGTQKVQDMLQEIASGKADLSTRLDETTGDESADIAKVINPFLQRFQELVGNVSDTSKQLSKDLVLISNVVSSSAESLKDNANMVQASSSIVNESATAAAEGADRLNSETGRIANTARSVSTDMRKLAELIQGLSSSISTIDHTAADADVVAKEVLTLADKAHATMENLSKAAEEIDRVVELIDGIQRQTNLLSLNATIEAERAGQYGRGFAVVAQEVKSLSQSAAGATDEIRKSLAMMQGTTDNAADILRQVSETIGVINNAVSQIRTTANKETASVARISNDVVRSANSVVQVSEDISKLSDEAVLFAGHVRQAAQHSMEAVQSVDCLRDEVANSLQTAQMVERSSEKLTKLASELTKTSGERVA